MQLRKATRQKAKIRLGMSGPSGFGKTFSALLLAKGLSGAWDKIAIIDSENNSADLYSHLGSYNVLPIAAPFTPEKYIEAIKVCEQAGMEVIIVDSISHEWDGKGGCLEIVESLGGKYQDWAKVTPRHQAFVEAIVSSPVHIITTVRRKQDYEMTKGNDGKMKVEKAGLREITREGFEYELTVNLELIDANHHVRASKDRTFLFSGKPEFVITEQTGELLRQWCETGEDVAAVEARKYETEISDCATQKDLVKFYNLHRKEVDSNPDLQRIISVRRAAINAAAEADKELLASWQEHIDNCKTLDELTQLWNGNAEVIEAHPALKNLFQTTRDKMQNA